MSYDLVTLCTGVYPHSVKTSPCSKSYIALNSSPPVEGGTSEAGGAVGVGVGVEPKAEDPFDESTESLSPSLVALNDERNEDL